MPLSLTTLFCVNTHCDCTLIPLSLSFSIPGLIVGTSLHEDSDLGLCTGPDPLVHRLEKRSYLPPISCTNDHEITAVQAKVHCQPRPRVVKLPWPNDTSVTEVRNEKKSMPKGWLCRKGEICKGPRPRDIPFRERDFTLRTCCKTLGC